ncbi:MAG: ATP-dependent sacrificial sulfur transferase LarE [Candidatus Latescibacterota bacterium]|jgi:uncharacterized protein
MTVVASPPTELDQKLTRLEEILRPMGRVLIGYSGGVDSATLAVAARRVLGDGAVAVTAVSESYAEGELEIAAEICRQFDIRHEVIHTQELANPDYARNPTNRCYFCKRELLVEMEEVARRLGLEHVIYGQNADDSGDFRPGAQAARERGARAPLAEAGITKAEIRELARRWGLKVWDRPATACLSSRFPYGTAITAEGLRMVDRAEQYLRLSCGFTQVRARHHGEVSRLELIPEELTRILAEPELRRGTAEAILGLGYRQVTVDLRGFRSGSMNEVIGQAQSLDPEVAVEAALTALGLSPHAAERHERMICLRLTEAGIAILAEVETRRSLVTRLEAAGVRYAALDLVPLTDGAARVPADPRTAQAG